MNPRATRNWPEIVDQYRVLVEEKHSQVQPMLALVEFLAASRYASSLSPSTSRETFLIARVPNFGAEESELRIHFDSDTQEFTFTCAQRPDDPSPWTRDCAAAEWPRVLERILHKRLQWFHEG
jgi:hypothetical protein